MNFCSKCGSADLQFRVPEGDNRSRYICTACNSIFYSNPKVVCGCLPIWEDQVLLCKRSIQPRAGYWNVPGGYLENGETVEEGAVREVWEEARTRVDILGLHSVYSIPHIAQVYLHFLARLREPKFEVGEESLEVRLFREDDIPWEDIAFTSSTFSLQRYFSDLRNGRRQLHRGQLDWK
ncbi:MAG: NUDIX hydrolase [Saprospiraceae bacterium]|nr:NUDIX hydrolase [Saprospiraceae bacterium]